MADYGDILGAPGAFDRRPEPPRPRPQALIRQPAPPPAYVGMGQVRLAESQATPTTGLVRPQAMAQPPVVRTAPQAMRAISSVPRTASIVTNAPQAAPPSRMQAADLIGVRTEALDALRREQLELRAMTMVPRGQRDQEAINRKAALIRDIRRQGASADRLLRDQNRATLTPEELAKSQQALAGQFQQIREGRLLRARQAEERAAHEVNRIRASGGALGGVEDAQGALVSAIRERQNAESLPETLTFPTPNPEDVARQQTIRAQRLAADEAMVTGALQAREQTGSTLPASVQQARAEAEAVRQAEQQRRVQEASGLPPVSPLEQAQIGLIGAQAEGVRAGADSTRAEIGLTGARTELASAEADRLRRTPVVDPIAQERGGLENELLREQVSDLKQDSGARRAIARAEQATALDTALIQAHPEIQGVAVELSNVIGQFSGRVTSMNNTQRAAFNGARQAFANLPEPQRRAAARIIIRQLANSGSFEFLTNATSDSRQNIAEQYGNFMDRLFGKESRENQQAWQRTFTEVANEAHRLATQE